jgi:RNA polymerase sigma factor (sigma-70 family)
VFATTWELKHHAKEVSTMTAKPIPSAHHSDELLWQRSRAGDREAFGQIVGRYQTLVCSLADSASASLAQSEDLAQETYITAWQRLGELRDPMKLKAWLCGIAPNVAASAHRQERRRGPSASLDDVNEPASADADPLGQVVSQEQETLVWNCLAQLPESCREASALLPPRRFGCPSGGDPRAQRRSVALVLGRLFLRVRASLRSR